MTAADKSLLTVTVSTRWTAELRGKPAVRVLRKAGVQGLFSYQPPSGGGKCWMFPAARVGDVLAAAEVSRGVRVVLNQWQEALL